MPQPNTSTPKLRDSCTNCATSKVKCSKDKPNCARCKRRNLPCEYATSQRSGRTTATAPAQATKVATVTQEPAGAANQPARPTLHKSSYSSPVLHNESQRMQALPPAGMMTTTTTPSLASPDLDDFLASLTTISEAQTQTLGQQQHHQPSPRYRQGSYSSTSDLGGFDVFSSSSQLSDAGTELTAQSLDSFSPDLSCCGHSTPPACNDCCLTKAMDLLRRQCPNASDACILPTSREANCKLPTIGSVVAENKQTIDAIGTMLECPCSLDEYVATLICLVVLKMLAWYGAAAREAPTPDEDMDMDWQSAGAFQDFQPNPYIPQSEEVLRFPTVIGSYHVSGAHHNRMAATAVLGELHGVQRLVKRLAERLQGVKASNRSPTEPCPPGFGATGWMPDCRSGSSRSPLSASTLDYLERDIRKRLRTVSLDNIETIRG